MSRNWYASPRSSSEIAPLLASVPEDEEVDQFVRIPTRIPRRSQSDIFVGAGLKKVDYLAPRATLPLHIRPRRRRDARPTWKTILTVAAALLLLICIIAAAVVLDNIEHSTGPFPAPPSIPKGDPAAPERNPAFLITAKHGAVATENQLCSNIGVDVLKGGGNAVDAAIAATFCIGVVNMFSSGIGGGGFMTVRLPPSHANGSSSVWAIDFRETAPAASNSSMYEGRPEAAMFGGLAVGVPGEVRGLEEAHRRWGSVPWKTLIKPSIDLASGWLVGAELGRRIEMFSLLMLNNPDWQEIFAPGGVLLRAGDLIQRKNYSRTLEIIATGGADALYKGKIADAIVEKVQATGGILTHRDLELYKVKVAPALEGTFKGKRVYTTLAPTSGPVLLHMLNLLEQFDLKHEGRSGLNTHRLVEVLKFGFAARTKICDPSYTNDTSRIEEISKKDFGNLIRPNITDDTTHPPEYYNPIYDIHEDHGTSHTAVVDRNGMAVSLTSTVNFVFGSLVLDPITGIILNDEMDDFSIPGTPNGYGLWPSPYNYPEPHKRPLSSTCPTIMEHEDGSFYLAVGGSGGTRIFGAVLQVILGVDRWGLDVSQAIEFGRVHDQLYPTVVDIDDIYPAEGIEALQERGHNVTVSDIRRVAAVVQAVVQEDDTIYAASDSRKNGIAAGY